jgi:hypothetical protein
MPAIPIRSRTTLPNKIRILRNPFRVVLMKLSIEIYSADYPDCEKRIDFGGGVRTATLEVFVPFCFREIDYNISQYYHED